MTPLDRLLRRRIAESGPITVSEFMALASAHPEHGYYARGDPFGRAGDFATAPEISQVFGELLGLWAAVAWRGMGAPGRVLLVECGPGRGTMMRDMLRAARTAAGFARAAELHLVETGRALRRAQQETLRDESPRWHESLDSLPSGCPMILVANEFFDALPVRQLVRTQEGWAERRIAGAPGGGFGFVVGEEAADALEIVPRRLSGAAPGAILEISRAGRDVAGRIGRRLARDGGVALVIDYGHDRAATGETLQAVRGHAFADPLSRVGETDLTAHVDFEALAGALRRGGAATWGPASQRRFLRALGVEERTARLAAAAPPAAAAVRAATERLIDPAGMGTLFKALAATAPDLPAPAGFEG